MSYSRLRYTAIYETYKNQLIPKFKLRYFWTGLLGFAIFQPLLFLLSCGELPTEPQPLTQPAMKGYSYTSFNEHGFELGIANNALGQLQTQTGTDYIALNVFLFQDTCTSTTIFPTSTTSTDDDIRIAVQDARNLGMKVFLKPNLDPLTGHWRGFIQPDAQGEWFGNYTKMMLHYATLAQELNCEMFSVGCELIAATKPEFTNNWTALIQQVRTVYSGKLIYCANWSGNTALGLPQPEFEQVEFWNYLDYIGIDAYYPLTQSFTDDIPSLNKGIKAFSPFVKQVEQLAQRTNKSVVFAECGIPSVQGAMAAPWDFQRANIPSAIPDEYVQHQYYAVLIESLHRKQWFLGFFWWNWESTPSPNTKTNYTIQNKSAARLLKMYYQPEVL